MRLFILEIIGLMVSKQFKIEDHFKQSISRQGLVKLVNQVNISYHQFSTFVPLKNSFMVQKITLSLKESNVKFIKNHAAATKKSVSKIVDDYVDLLHKIDLAAKKEKPNAFVKEFSGMISTGKNETKNSIF